MRDDCRFLSCGFSRGFSKVVVVVNAVCTVNHETGADKEPII